jgi:hypothetical protein
MTDKELIKLARSNLPADRARLEAYLTSLPDDAPCPLRQLFPRPNAETIAAMKAHSPSPDGRLSTPYDRGEARSFNSVEELMADLNAPAPPVDMFQFTSLFPRSSGLPCTIWISEHGFVTIDPHNPAADVMRPSEVEAWIELNRKALLAHWRGDIDSMALVARLRKLPA